MTCPVTKNFGWAEQRDPLQKKMKKTLTNDIRNGLMHPVPFWSFTSARLSMIAEQTGHWQVTFGSYLCTNIWVNVGFERWRGYGNKNRTKKESLRRTLFIGITWTVQADCPRSTTLLLFKIHTPYACLFTDNRQWANGRYHRSIFYFKMFDWALLFFCKLYGLHSQ